MQPLSSTSCNLVEDTSAVGPRFRRACRVAGCSVRAVLALWSSLNCTFLFCGLEKSSARPADFM